MADVNSMLVENLRAMINKDSETITRLKEGKDALFRENARLTALQDGSNKLVVALREDNARLAEELHREQRHTQEHIDDKHRILRGYEEKVQALNATNARLRQESCNVADPGGFCGKCRVCLLTKENARLTSELGAFREQHNTDFQGWLKVEAERNRLREENARLLQLLDSAATDMKHALGRHDSRERGYDLRRTETCPCGDCHLRQSWLNEYAAAKTKA